MNGIPEPLASAIDCDGSLASVLGHDPLPLFTKIGDRQHGRPVRTSPDP